MQRRVSAKVFFTMTSLQAGSIHCSIPDHSACTFILFGWCSDTALHLSLKEEITRKLTAACILHGLDPNQFINPRIIQLVFWSFRIHF